MPDTLASLTDAILAAARKAGAEEADALAGRATSLSIDVRNRTLEQAERSEDISIGLRVMVGQRQANVSASDTSAETLAMMAERAVAMARSAPLDPHIRLAGADEYARNWDLGALELVDPAPEPEPAVLENHAREAEATALDDPRISQVQSASASYSRRALHLATSKGFSGGYERSGNALLCVAIAGTGSGMERDHDGDSRIFRADMRDAKDIGQTAATRAAERIGARQPPTGQYPVLFDERISSSLIGHLLGAVNGAAIARGASFLRDALGELVLPENLTLTEDPHRPRVPGSRPFDGEGMPTARRLIVDRGRLTGWTLDLANAHKLGLASTANAARGTSTPPSPANWNVTLSPGNHSREDLIAAMGTGLLVTSMIGATINPDTGDYSRGASGFWIENGEIAHAVNECTIAGNLRDMLRHIIAADDARPHLSHVVPSLLVEGMTLAGG